MKIDKLSGRRRNRKTPDELIGQGVNDMKKE